MAQEAPRRGHPGADRVIGGVVVALFVVASTLLAARVRSFAGVVVAASFALLAHGGVLTLEGQVIGALFLGLAPIVCVLTSLAFATPSAGEEQTPQLAPQNESLDIAYDATLVAEWFDKATPTALMTRPTSATPFNAVPARPASPVQTTRSRKISRTIACGAGLVASPSRPAMLA